MPPTVTILNRLFWPKLYGGLERVLWNAANAFADTGVQVRVQCESAADTDNDQTVRPGLTIQRHTPVDFGRLWRVGELVQMRWWKQIITQAPPSDWYWASEPTAAAAVIRLGLADRLFYRPVFCYDGLTHVAKTIPEMAPLGRSFLARKLDRYAYKHAAVIIQQSTNIRQQHTRWYGPNPNALIVPNATPGSSPGSSHASGSLVEISGGGGRQSFGLNDQHFVIGFVGRPGDPCKDLPFLIDALKAQPLPDHARLLMVGGDAHIEQAKQWVQDAGLAPHTLWTGNLDDTAPAYAAMDALVLPSRFETFGNVIAEAHAHGVPALARTADFSLGSPVYTASDDLIDHGTTGYLVDSHNPADLGNQLQHLIANPDKAKTMGQTAQQRANSYTWPDAAERYLQAMGIETCQTIPTLRAA